jgi:hypothetical protein
MLLAGAGSSAALFLNETGEACAARCESALVALFFFWDDFRK